MDREVKVFFVCCGVGVTNRGIESFFRESFDGLRSLPTIKATLYKGSGPSSDSERELWNLPRAGRAARFLGSLIRRNGYVIEQLSSLPSMINAIRLKRPDVIFYSDSNLGFQLYRWRKQIGVPYRLLFSNGGPCHPPFDRTDYIHQVAPQYFDEAVAAGESASRHRMVPYGINVPEGEPDRTLETVVNWRRKLELPTGRPIVLSVGWISAKHKRMDYLINELAELPRLRPFLVLLGAKDERSEDIVSLAKNKLGPENFVARSVPYEEVAGYYQAANLFVLASLQEGFGRVFLEALMAGLPVIAHDHPVMRFVLGKEGIFGDLALQGELATLIPDILATSDSAGAASRRRASVRDRFSWPVLAPKYRDMFYDCLRTPVRVTANQ